MDTVKWEDLSAADQEQMRILSNRPLEGARTALCELGLVRVGMYGLYYLTEAGRALLPAVPNENDEFRQAATKRNGARQIEEGDSDDPLTDALLEGDYAGIRKMFDEMKSRLEYLEAMNMGREYVDAQILELVQKHAPYVEYEELASPQLIEAIDKHISEMAVRIAELAQEKNAASVEQLAAVNRAKQVQIQVQVYKDSAALSDMQYRLERENSQLLYHTLVRHAPNAFKEIEPQLNQSNAERDKVLGEYWRRLHEAQSTISGLEDTCVDLVKVIQKRNRQVQYWMGLLDTKNYQLEVTWVDEDALRDQRDALRQAAAKVVSGCEAVGVIPFGLGKLKELLTVLDREVVREGAE